MKQLTGCKNEGWGARAQMKYTFIGFLQINSPILSIDYGCDEFNFYSCYFSGSGLRTKIYPDDRNKISSGYIFNGIR